MHAHELADLADLAALAALHGNKLITVDAATMDGVLAPYWKASRCRLDRWCRSLALATRASDCGPWTKNEIGTIEEILVSEILTRIVTALAVAHDQHHSTGDSGPVARNIFKSHLDVKRRAVALVVAPHRDEQQAEEFLALRRQCERWTDLLLAYLAPHSSIDEFAADPGRVSDFAFDAHEHIRSGKPTNMAVTMVMAGLRSSLNPRTTQRSPNADLNLEIGNALVGGFSPDHFDSHGHLRSTWLDRLATPTADTPLTSDNWWHAAHAGHDTPRPTNRRW